MLYSILHKIVLCRSWTWSLSVQLSVSGYCMEYASINAALSCTMWYDRAAIDRARRAARSSRAVDALRATHGYRRSAEGTRRSGSLALAWAASAPAGCVGAAHGWLRAPRHLLAARLSARNLQEFPLCDSPLDECRRVAEYEGSCTFA